MDEHHVSFEREQVLRRQVLSLTAATYNLTRILLAESATGCVFVPIRSMQYLAVIDAEEIIFVDGEYRRWVELAWQGFKPQDRGALDEPVVCQVVVYTPDGVDVQRRLPREFHAALVQIAARRQLNSPAHILQFKRPAASPEL